ncbi:MAG TPA: GNAT family N-acetyltransferase [Caldilineaceae bacterium]|nr:GNAT family N-acetyltransferase [Caldilineaceae bacterium]
MANATLRCQTYSTATPFLAKMRPLLEVNEAANGLLLGLALRVEGDPHAFGNADPYFATVEDDTDVIVAALMTPPHGVILYGARPAADVSIPAALQAIVENLQSNGWSVPTVNGPSAISECFAQIWSTMMGLAFEPLMATRVFQLREVRHPYYSAGHLRLATKADQALATQWWRAFSQEAEHNDEVDEVQLHKSIRQKIADRHLFFWEDGEPVSMVALTRPTAHGTGIGPVYTPPQYRGRGYASSAVAQLSQQVLDTGKEFCALFTDVANPTSNHIYQAIGYRRLVDFQVYRFISRKATV